MSPLSRLAPLALLAACLTQALAFSPGFNYGGTKVRGVNLGGWLVLEPWITPSLFENTGNNAIVDEYTFGQLQDKNTAAAALKKHWDSWITEQDFADIAAAGLNHVRLPIGYWAWDVSGGEPFIQGQLPYLDKAVAWAGNHGLKVIVDLHGVPGSQNGFDNSGQRRSYPAWQTSSSYISRSNNIIKQIAAKYRDNVNVVPIIAPLNEPAGFDGDVLPVATQFWYDSYGNIRYPYGDATQSNTLILFHDAFQGLGHWSNFMTDTNTYQGIAFDTHIYQMFSQDEVSRSNSAHLSSACSHKSDLANFHLWAIVGEWTPAPTDCAKWLNGRGTGARYDGSLGGSTYVGDCSKQTGSGASFSSSYKTFLRQYWEAQVQTFEAGAGWIQWTWKAENADDWAYQAGLKYGWIPQNPTNYQYPNICG